MAKPPKAPGLPFYGNDLVVSEVDPTRHTPPDLSPPPAWLQGFCLLFVEHESYFMTLISGLGVVGSRQKGPEQGQPGWPLVNISLTVPASTASSLCPHFRLGLKKVPTS